MIRKMLIGCLFTLCASLFGVVAQASEQPIPAMSRTVVDTTGWLNSQESLELEKRVKALRDNRGVQLAILIVSTTTPETIEQYSLRVAEKWKVGKKGEDSGLLLTLARNDRKFRLEVGYGLEGKIPDLLAKSILDEAMKPHLRNAKPFDALVAGVSAIDTALAKDPPKKPEKVATSADEESVAIPFFDDLNSVGKMVAVVLGVIGGVLLLAGMYGGSGEALAGGILIPIVGGALIGLLVNITQFVFVAITAFIIALIIALGLTIGGAVIGGAFGGGGASSDW